MKSLGRQLEYKWRKTCSKCDQPESTLSCLLSGSNASKMNSILCHHSSGIMLSSGAFPGCDVVYAPEDADPETIQASCELFVMYIADKIAHICHTLDTITELVQSWDVFGPQSDLRSKDDSQLVRPDEAEKVLWSMWPTTSGLHPCPL